MWSIWPDNPYNAVNGGPARSSAEFFTDPEALRLSRQFLRYVVARFSGYRSLFAFEVMNEMDLVEGANDLATTWSQQRAREIRSLDPHLHLVTTSLGIRPWLATPSAYESDAYSLSQTHAYGGAFETGVIGDIEALRAFHKPILFGEFGIDYLGRLENEDPRGLHLAEASWIALAGGYSGGAMSWWWDTYVRPNDLFGVQTPVARVAGQVDLRGVHGPLPSRASASDHSGAPLEVFGRDGDPLAFLIVRSPAAGWETAKDQGLPVVDGARLSYPTQADRRLSARLFDTQTGELSGSLSVTADASGLATFELPSFVGVLALELTKGEVVPSGNHLDPAGGCSTAPLRGKSVGSRDFGILVLAFTHAMVHRRRRMRIARCSSPSRTRARHG
jgi:hypothetical protein